MTQARPVPASRTRPETAARTLWGLTPEHLAVPSPVTRGRHCTNTPPLPRSPAKDGLAAIGAADVPGAAVQLGVEAPSTSLVRGGR